MQKGDIQRVTEEIWFVQKGRGEVEAICPLFQAQESGKLTVGVKTGGSRVGGPELCV